MPSATIPARARYLLGKHVHLRGGGPLGTGLLSVPARRSRRPLLARLERALREGMFVLHYQPIVSLGDGRISHYEALVRLQEEPDGPPLPPSEFLPAAERYGLIQELDRVVVRKAVEVLGRESLGAGVRVAVNLSAHSVVDPGMLAFIGEELAARGVAPGELVIEITETAEISDMGRARAFCEGVAELGCGLALDDFGVGFGSFYHLKHLPFGYLKIDGDFIRGISDSPRDQLLVQALVQLARGLEMETIAEYVGDRATIELLRELGVDYAQGFALGRPRPLAAASA
ncbi:MAG TPA: EAL domain-containing protein [Solirubrobacteraceae bacterium]|jgi:EAL domain-containing protein (putative c-di-GMP-specific phosphodiesterase class I)|nr:EAL domain-containing protein [Solirubrobacteraceae bacterium]